MSSYTVKNEYRKSCTPYGSFLVANIEDYSVEIEKDIVRIEKDGFIFGQKLLTSLLMA